MKMETKIERTPWRDRLMLWAGLPFRSRPLPYLFQRWDVNVYYELHPEPSWFGGFFRRKSAEEFVREMTVMGQK